MDNASLLPNATSLGLLLVGHGTGDEDGQSEMLELAGRVAQRLPDVSVEPCFLEFAQPTIDEGVGRLVRRGAKSIVVAPVLLFAAGHAKRDIPAAVEKAAHQRQLTDVRMAAPLGCHPAVVELSTLRYHEALENCARLPPEQTLLIFVGRGSHDHEANSDLAKFARLRWEQTPTGWLQPCYLAMTRPTLVECLGFAARQPFQRIVVQPHLLFQGELLHRVSQEVAAARHNHPEKEWIVVEHLGAAEQIVEAVVQRSSRPECYATNPGSSR